MAQRRVASDQRIGKRVTVQIDGGRTKLRGELRERTPVAEETDNDGVATSDTPGRSKKGSSEEFVGGLVDIATSWTSAQARQRGSAPRASALASPLNGRAKG